MDANATPPYEVMTTKRTQSENQCAWKLQNQKLFIKPSTDDIVTQEAKYNKASTFHEKIQYSDELW